MIPLRRHDLLAGSARVGNVKNNDPPLIQPITLPPGGRSGWRVAGHYLLLARALVGTFD
jgi:hypothetical protein